MPIAKGAQPVPSVEFDGADGGLPVHRLQVVDMTCLVERLDLAAERIAKRLSDVDCEVLAGHRSLEQILRRSLRITVSDTLAGEDVKLARPLYRGVREDGNPIVFLVKHYKNIIEKSAFFQSDLGRCDEVLLNSLRNASKSKYWRSFYAEADVELRKHGPEWSLMFGRRVKDATSLGDLIPPRRNLEKRLAQLQIEADNVDTDRSKLGREDS